MASGNRESEECIQTPLPKQFDSGIRETNERDEHSMMNISNGNDSVIFTPVVDDYMKPIVSKTFRTLDDAMKFYDNYTGNSGFDTRIFGTKTVGDVITWRYVVCSREGNKNTVESDSSNARARYINRHRRRSKRCECKARVVFKFVAGNGYVVDRFDEVHNHTMIDNEHKRFMRLNRRLDSVHQRFIVDCAKASIGPTLTYKLMNESLGGYDTVGCTVVEVRNFARDMKAFIEGSDAQMLLNEMRRKKDLCSSFTYEFEVDKEDKLKRLFWCDAESRRNYLIYGDVVAFDTTYSTNKYCMIFAPFTGKDNHGRPVTFAAGLLSNEDADLFSWLFKQFINCMGQLPRLIITDQELGMRVAIERVLSGTRHRWCMWHIMLKLSDKVSKDLHANEDFKKLLNACVWSDLIEPEIFEESWNGIMERFELSEVEWFSNMFELRRFWVPAYFRDLPMGCLLRTTSASECKNNFFKRYTKSRCNLIEFLMSFDHAILAQRNHSLKLNYSDSSMVPIMATNVSFEKQAAAVYSDSMFKVVQAEIVKACFRCQMTCINAKSFGVADNLDGEFYVDYDSYFCRCKMFTRIGILCSHIFFVMKNEKVKLIPEKYIAGRWLKHSLVKHVHDTPYEDAEVNVCTNEKQKLLNKLYSSFFGLVQKVEGNIHDIEFLIGAVQDAEKSMTSNGMTIFVASKKKIIKDFCGSQKT